MVQKLDNLCDNCGCRFYLSVICRKCGTYYCELCTLLYLKGAFNLVTHCPKCPRSTQLVRVVLLSIMVAMTALAIVTVLWP